MYIILFLIIFIQNISEQKNESLELEYFNSDSYYYNLVQSEDGVLVGSNEGVFKVEEAGVVLLNSTLVGPITITKNSKIETGTVLYDDRYKFSLPLIYQTSLQNFLETPTNVFIVSRGDLFVFKKVNVKVERIPSIRSISETYLGTYGGIFNRSGELAFTEPTFTNSYIREFDSITFVNWYGLTIKSKSQIKHYNDKNGEGIRIGDQLLKEANDVALLKYPEFLLLTGTGTYQFNIQSEALNLIRPNNSGVLNFIRDEKNINGVERIFLYDKEKILQYNVETGTFNELILSEDIFDVVSNSASEYYILTNSGLYYYNLRISKAPEKLISNDYGYHSFGYFKDFIFLMSDNGLNFYSLKSGRVTKPTIKDEFNKKASYITEDTLYLGSVNGLYSLDYDTVNNLFLNNVEPFPKRIVPWYYYVLIFLSLIILYLSFLIFQYRTSNESITEFSEQNILKFIKQNIATVSIKSICLEFNITPNDVYKISINGKKPGQIIRQERVRLVRKMRSSNKTEKEISEKTGFSVSYLRKI